MVSALVSFSFLYKKLNNNIKKHLEQNLFSQVLKKLVYGFVKKGPAYNHSILVHEFSNWRQELWARYI